MVANLGWIASGEWSNLENEVALVRQAIGASVVLKVILETGLWSGEQIIAACKHSVSGGADYVKTSTGFHKAGGASLEAVRTMRKTVGADIGVKASGGIRTTADALAMIEAGASRIGASASRAILNGLK
jgi:deoxyribose-phosphate aldolase